MSARGIGGLVAFVALLAACASKPANVGSVSPAQSGAASGAPVDPLDRPTPMSSKVLLGKLENGLTYYVRRHRKPEQRAALWLAVDAGSVLESDDQRGLAHFVEHMAFNGTARFPKRDIIDFLERSGMTIGADVNATTDFDQTLYKFTVPTDDESIVLRGFDVLYDIARHVSFDPKEVELERPVILEERRLQLSAGRRLFEKRVPLLFQGSRYAERLAIGLPETIRSAPVERLKKFYDDWYRPESMAVIAVGDFDPARVESEIRRRFADLRGLPGRRERPRFVVPHEHQPSIVALNDPELRSSLVHVYDKVEPLPKRTLRDYRRYLVEELYLGILRVRLAEIRDDPARPFVSASIERRHFTRTLDAITYTIGAKEGRVEEAIEALFAEIERARRYGFLLSETLRIAKNLVTRFEVSLEDADKAPADALASELVRNYFEDEQVPGPELELAWVHEFLPAITLDELGELARARSGELGRVIAVSTPGSIAPPSEARVAELVANARGSKLERWKDTTVDQPLIATPPAPGRVVQSTRDAAADASVWTLSNGVRVVVKPTSFHKSSVVLLGFQPGGTSLASDDDFVHARFADDIVGRSGAGKFSERDLRRILVGRNVSVSVELDELGESVEASARFADIATMFELLYLRLTQARVHTNAFEVWKGKSLDIARHRADSPERAFLDEVFGMLSGDHLRRRPPNVAMIESVSMEKAFAAWQARFADLGGFTFVIVGSFDPNALKPLVETYLGSLPSRSPHESWKDLRIPYPVGKIEKTMRLGSEAKSRVKLVFAGPSSFGLDAARDARILEALLELRLVEILREKLGGIYVVDVDARFEREPSARRRLEVAFSCAPDNVDKLVGAVFDELRSLAQNGIGDDYLAKVRQRLERQRQVDLEENGWWANRLLYAYRHGDDFGALTDVGATVRRVTHENVKAIAARMFDEKNYVLAVLRPASAPKSMPTPPAGSTAVFAE